MQEGRYQANKRSGRARDDAQKNRIKKPMEKAEIAHCADIGRVVTYQVRRFSEHGIYLGREGDADVVLLPAKEQPTGLKMGDKLDVFIYRDSSDRPIATVRKPMLTLGDFCVLKVSAVTKVGAFLDWGLEKELLLPFHEMTGKPVVGDEVLVRLYLDKSERLCATQKHLYELLSTHAPYTRGDEVAARVYEFGRDFGTFVAVDDAYSAMIPRTEDVSDLKIGDVITVRVTGVKEDGKLDVSRRGGAHTEIDADAARVMEKIEQYGGTLPFDDHASPQRIFDEVGLSKAAFKRAVGRLYKERKILIEENQIRKQIPIS